MMETFLYIDPGTGSMLFSIFIALVATCTFAVRAVALKVKFIIAGGKQTKLDSANKGIVIFTDDKRYWNIFGPLCKEAEKRGVPLNYYTQSEDDPAFSQKFEHVKCTYIGAGNKGLALMNLLVADIVISSTPNLGVYQWKRSRNTKYYVHIMHSTDDLMNYRMFSVDSYDAVLLTGAFQEKIIRRMEALQNGQQKELRVTGYIPMDEAAKRIASQKEQASEQKEAHKAGGKLPTVLIAPSWGSQAILSKYGTAFLKAVVSTGYNIIIRPHPQSKKSEATLLDDLMKAFPSKKEGDKSGASTAGGGYLEWNFDNDNFDCLMKSDILITDFSGIVYDWAFLFNKPFIYSGADFDTDVYEAAWFSKKAQEATGVGHGETLWRYGALKKMGVCLDESQFKNMKQVIDEALTSDTLKQGREEVANEAWQCRGEATTLVLDYLLQKQTSLKESALSKAASGQSPKDNL